MNGTAATVVVAMAALLGVRAPAPASAQLAPGTRRSLISSGTRESLTPTITLSTPEPALGRLSFTISPGTTSCGGPGLNPPPAAPFSGRVDNLDGSERADLGLGRLYFGGGSATTFPPSSIPDGGTSVLAVTGISGLALALGPDPGSGPADCTLGAGPARHCLNGAPGTDGTGACSADSQCVGGTPIGACDLDANCFFGPPVPVPGPIASLSVCIMNAIGVGVAGTADAGSTTVSTTLSSRVYITGNATSPCPQCVSGACTYGERARMACSGGVGSRNTTIECPPGRDGLQRPARGRPRTDHHRHLHRFRSWGELLSRPDVSWRVRGGGGQDHRDGFAARREPLEPVCDHARGHVLHPRDRQRGGRRAQRSSGPRRGERARHHEPGSATAVLDWASAPGSAERP